ncbi:MULTISPECIES: DUF4064 domain-containing protein [Staphylococcus]|uniref:DUF4064 domain-containing protein n=1 Tax=Staphylococcus lugdunensis TaxID=28035 RepID=A0ABD4EHZ8_STALU|nr:MULTISPECIES: DUF4064 domain-containing protein [Staphylococcus]ARJ14305.1 hypothetical protein B7468_08250 [Staphylococcus lugdunensis]EFU84696.1 hypothetical protein HMPREF0790_0666 [Staphylococcus lugdunensis M23590]KXA40041.1 hypothetical protein HMPREF3225_00391 [Staphylococcus lugdunensis]MCH8666159.1 DUF4064 domain-containing protein [Staphylococcus lugdunensis]OFJ65169.1 hypothetical protein HMPREF2855_00865 [Staphylococcus sp. HMSC077E11]
MKTKKELVIAWIANGLSLIFLLFNILSMLLTDEKNNVKEYEQMAKQFAGKNVTVTPELIHFIMVFFIGILAFSTILGIAATTLIKNRSLIAIFLFISAVLIGLFSMNIIAMILWLIVIVLLIVKRNQYKNDSDWHVEQYKHAEKKENPYIY